MERLTNVQGLCIECIDCNEKFDCEAECNAIDDCIKKLSAYEDTGLTPEQVRELAEKQTPMKAEKSKSVQYPYRCPQCGFLLEVGYKHCISCGQRLEYEKEADDE